MGKGVTVNGNGGFRRLARYIGVFGVPENGMETPIAMTAPVVTEAPSITPTKIAMTAPVVTQNGNAGANATMAFLLPAEFAEKHASVGTLPQPSNPAVRLREVPESIVAVSSFSGYVSEAKVREKLSALRRVLRSAGLHEAAKNSGAGAPGAAAGEADEAAPCEWRLAQYHPPYTLPWFRLNEIWVTLRDDEAEVATRLAAAGAGAPQLNSSM